MASADRRRFSTRSIRIGTASFKHLSHLVKQAGHRIDLSVKASFYWNGKPHAAVTPVEFSEEANASRKNADAEKQLLISMDKRRQLIEVIRRGDSGRADKKLGCHPRITDSRALAAGDLRGEIF